jgi:hypothetical protein
MKRIIAEVFKRPDGWLTTMLYCVQEDGAVDRAITDTLLDLIEQSFPDEDHLDRLIALGESGAYVSPDKFLPDWGVNDINLWLVAPMAQLGHICVSNENVGDYSVSDGGQAQQFTYEQFRVAMKHWRQFRELIAKEGKENLVGRRFETPWP